MEFKIKKLDRRYRLFNLGYANYVINLPLSMPVVDSNKIQEVLSAGYGRGQYIPSYLRYVVRKPAEWMYDYVGRKDNQNLRIFLKYEEQITYLNMMLSDA